MAEEMDNKGTQGNEQGGQEQAQQGGAGLSTEKIAEALVAALDARQKRAETSVLRSFAEQYGMTEDEVKGILDTEKQKRDAEIPPEAKKQIEAERKALEKRQNELNGRIVNTVIREKAAALGCVDIDAALVLVDREHIAIGDDEKVIGVEEALADLKDAKAYLFGAQPKDKATGGYGTGLQHGTEHPDDDAAIRKALGLPPKN